MPDSAPIFLSYAHEDIDVVQSKIINSLKQCRLWWDGGGDNGMPTHQGIPAGANFPAEIQKAIRDCRVFLFALSDNSIKSEWCRRELSLASRCGKTILPILVEDRTDEKLPAEISETQWLDLTGKMAGRENLLPDWLQEHGFYKKRLSRQTLILLTAAFVLGVVLGVVIPLLLRNLTPVESILKSLIDREAQAVLTGDAGEISAIYMDHAIIEDADPNGRIWQDAMAYYTQNRLNIFYCRAEHNDFEVVTLTNNYARVSTSSEGAFGSRANGANIDNCPSSYENPRGADIWEFVRDDDGQWRISRFTFNAHRK